MRHRRGLSHSLLLAGLVRASFLGPRHELKRATSARRRRRRWKIESTQPLPLAVPLVVRRMWVRRWRRRNHHDQPAAVGEQTACRATTIALKLPNWRQLVGGNVGWGPRRVGAGSGISKSCGCGPHRRARPGDCAIVPLGQNFARHASALSRAQALSTPVHSADPHHGELHSTRLRHSRRSAKLRCPPNFRFKTNFCIC